MPKSTLHRAVKLGLLWTTKSHIKPMLMEPNKAARVAYCLGNVQDNCFSNMLTRVDINEKWFYLRQVNTKYILVPGEKPPHRVCWHKSHIPKAIGLTAVVRPRPNPATGVWWDGKIGNWFFVEQVPAVRGSKNEPAGTLETKSVNVGRESSINMYISNLLPAIMEKWPAWEERVVCIQLDNAPVHPQPGKWANDLRSILPSCKTKPVGTLTSSPSQQTRPTRILSTLPFFVRFSHCSIKKGQIISTN